jgi:ribosomal-protein-alanine N-acetyltransferase
MFEELGYGGPDLLGRMVTTFQMGLADELTGGGYRGWLAMDEQATIVGSVGLRIRGWGRRARALTGKQGYVVGVYVEPHGRGRGIGKSLMRAMMDWSREYRLDCLILHPSSDKACAMYLAMGFQADSTAYRWTPIYLTTDK